MLPDSTSSPVPAIALLPHEVPLAESVANLSEAALITRADLDRPGPTIIGVSPGMTALTRYTPAELIGRTPRIFQGPLTDRAVLARIRERCAKGERFLDTAINYRKDGSTYVLQWTIEPLHGADGRITHFFSLQHDVTHQHRFASEWLDAETRARAAMAQASQAMALIAETILVLEKTKRSFRSKELGALRERLAQAARAFRAPTPPPASGSPPDSP